MIHPDMPVDADHNFGDQDVGDPVIRCDAKDPSKFKVRIVKFDRTGWHDTRLADPQSKTHEIASETRAARRQEVLDAAGLSFHGDIFASDMHTLFAETDRGKTRPTPLGIEAEDLWGNKQVLTDELCDALKAAGPPAAVVLIGCYTEPLLAKVIAAGVGAAFGIGPEGDVDSGVPFPVNANAHAAADNVTAALMLGKTLNQAAELGTKVMDPALQNTGSTAPIKVVVECGRNDPNKSLQDNHLLSLQHP